MGGGLGGLPEDSQIINRSYKWVAHWCFVCSLPSPAPHDGNLTRSFLISIPCLVFPPSVLVSVSSITLPPPSFSQSVWRWLLSSAPHSGAGSPVAKWPPAHDAPWYNNSTPCTGLIFVSLNAMRGFCLSFSMTAVHTYLPFYFEAWLTGWQPWHSCRRCGACYYAYINILINTWSAIEEIITCHHSTVWKECALLCASVHAHTFICLFHPINMISVPLVPPRPLMSSTAAPLIWKALCRSSWCTVPLRTHAKFLIVFFFLFFFCTVNILPSKVWDFN